MQSFAEKIANNGFAIVPGVLGSQTISSLLAQLAEVTVNETVKRRGQSYFGIRNLLNAVPGVRDLAESSQIRSIVEPIVGERARVVRGIFFDKTPEANWKVVWHQDVAIAVRQQKHVAGFYNWSVKSGIAHVQPSVSILESILTLRLHLDDADEANGALKVIPGSHKLGRIEAKDMDDAKRMALPVTCCVKQGDALAMRPLLLHSSSSSATPSHRRVVHLEFSSVELPGGLEWYGS